MIREMQDDTELLDLMLRDQDAYGPLYRPGPYWRGYQRRTVAAIRRHGLAQFRAIPAISKGYADAPVPTPRERWRDQGLAGRLKLALAAAPKLRALAADHEEALTAAKKEMRDYRDAYYARLFGDLPVAGLPDSLRGGCRDTVSIRGREVARIYLDFLARIQNFSGAIPFSLIRSALEIGGGFGAWPHILVTLYPNVRKLVYLDIPPMIYVGTQYLRSFFPTSVRDYRETRTLDRIAFKPDDDLEIICLCPWQVERFAEPVDLLWNSASFSEMPEEIVSNYARRIEAKTVCLVMNKSGAQAGTVSPQQIMAAFGEHEFELVTPRIERPRPMAYAVGRHQASLAQAV